MGVQVPEDGHHIPAEPVAAVGRVGVGAVGHPGDALGGEPVLDLLPGHRQEGADDDAPAGGNAGQSVQSGAPDQVKEDGLSVVVSIVGGGDGLGPQGFGGLTTALGLNIEVLPTHIAGMPCAVNIGCHATRHRTEVL